MRTVEESAVPDDNIPAIVVTVAYSKGPRQRMMCRECVSLFTASYARVSRAELGEVPEAQKGQIAAAHQAFEERSQRLRLQQGRRVYEGFMRRTLQAMGLVLPKGWSPQ